MAFTSDQLGALRMAGLEPDTIHIEMAWAAFSVLSEADQRALMLLILSEILRTRSSSN